MMKGGKKEGKKGVVVNGPLGEERRAGTVSSNTETFPRG